jgi:hypothetical protein
MTRLTCLALAAAVTLSGAGCATNHGSDADSKIPPLDTSDATCTGHFQFESAHYGTGQSQCRNGRALPFSADTEQNIAAGLVCNYTLTYTDPKHGTGKVACSDGATGTIAFTNGGHHNGVASAKLNDGRELTFTYHQ